MTRPRAAEGFMPFPGHRTMLRVLADEWIAAEAWRAQYQSQHHPAQTARPADADPRAAPHPPGDAGSADLHDRGSPPVWAAQAEHSHPTPITTEHRVTARGERDPVSGGALTRTQDGTAGASIAEASALEAGSTPARGHPQAQPINTIGDALAWLALDGITTVPCGAYWLVNGRAVPVTALVPYTRRLRDRLSARGRS